MVKFVRSLAGSRRICVYGKGRTAHENLLSPQKISVTLLGGFGDNLFALLEAKGIVDAAAAHFADVIHTHGGNGFHAGIDFGGADDEAAAAADADDADFFPVHKILGA